MEALPSILTGSMFGAGGIGNIIESYKKMQYQNYINDLMKHPEKLAALVSRFQKPLDNSLVQGVNNRVQADMAQRGLSQAPGIFAASESQALAPYQLQNEQSAQNAVMQMLGLGGAVLNNSAPSDNSGALSMFLKSLKGGGAGTGGGGSFGGGLTADSSSGTGDLSSILANI